MVLALNTIFASEFGPHLVFKGGTSLSKGYGIIDRFSEDVDVTYDIRAFAADLVHGDANGFPSTKSQAAKWTKEIRARLAEWVKSQALPVINAALHGLPAKAWADGEKLFIEYEPVTAAGSTYVKPVVMLEFGARSTGEPHEVRAVTCDAALHLPDVVFPTASPHVMRPERTFWEKATAMHVWCAQNHPNENKRVSRHWHDLTRLQDAGCIKRAIEDRALAKNVAEHKTWFFGAKDAGGAQIDYNAAANGELRIVPAGEAAVNLEEDYKRMVEGGLFAGTPEPFDELMKRSQAIQDLANKAAASGKV